MIRRSCASAAAAGMLASCTIGPAYTGQDYKGPVAAIDRDRVPALSEAETGPFSDGEPPGSWWRLYDAPELDGLIERALRHNTDLRVAFANLQAAQAVLRQIERDRTVQTGFTASGTYGQASADQRGAPGTLPAGPTFALGESVSYDFDLFGRLKRAIEAGKADVGSAEAALDLARVEVVAGVAGAYAAACAAGNLIAVTDRSIALARNIVSVTERRFAGGIAGINDVVRARALLAQTEAARPALVARQRASLYLLATLAGDTPDHFPAEAERCASLPIPRVPLPVGDGASLLRRRPDVRGAERRLAGSIARIGIASSQLYPSITFGGQAGIVATRGSDLLRSRAFTWSLGPLVHWTIPNRSAARAAIAQSEALARANLAAFDGVVLTALREADVALSALARQLDTERSLEQARREAALAAANTERLYRGGIAPFIDTLDAERTLIQADAALATAKGQVADLQVRLFLALGGGWQDAPTPGG